MTIQAARQTLVDDFRNKTSVGIGIDVTTIELSMREAHNFNSLPYKAGRQNPTKLYASAPVKLFRMSLDGACIDRLLTSHDSRDSLSALHQEKDQRLRDRDLSRQCV
jgi:hypothetical protein